MKTSGLFHPESIARNAMPILWQGHDLCASPHQQHIVSACPRISLKNRGFSSAQCEAPAEHMLDRKTRLGRSLALPPNAYAIALDRALQQR
jgi:hypothetical protein